MLTAVPFFISGALLAAFLGFRSWEERTGRRLWAHVRESYDTKVEELYKKLVLGSIPTEWRLMVLAYMHAFLHQIVLLSVELLRALERPLARLSHRMRMQAPQANGKEVSAFLKTIAPEKKTDSGQTEGGV